MNRDDKYALGCLVLAGVLIACMDSWMFDQSGILHRIFESTGSTRRIFTFVLDFWHTVKNILLVASYSLLPYFARRGAINPRWYLLGAIIVGLMFIIVYHVVLGEPVYLK